MSMPTAEELDVTAGLTVEGFRGEMSDKEWAEARPAIEAELRKQKSESETRNKPRPVTKTETPAELEQIGDDIPEAVGAEGEAPVEVDDTPTETNEVEPTDLEKALAALRRDGYTSKSLDKMGRKEIVEIGLKRAKVQADTDAAYADLRQLKARLAEIEAKSGGDAKTPASHTADLAPKLKRLTDLGYGEEEARELVGIASEETASLKSEIEQIKQANAVMRVNIAMRDLGDRFPEAKKPEVRKQVTEKMLRMGGGYDDIDECLDDVCKVLNLKPASAAQAARLGTAKRTGAEPPTGSRSTARKGVDQNTLTHLRWKASLPVSDGGEGLTIDQAIAKYPG